MSAITAYRALLRIVGPAYVVVAFLGRIPLAMSQIGVLLLVSQATGQYALGGAAAGVLAVANAIGAPISGGLADRFGQRPVVVVQSLAGALGLVAVVIATELDSPVGVVVAATAAGLALPQIGPLARVRWRPITADSTDQRGLVNAAFSYEGAADEASFVLGPALIGVLAIVLDPAGAVLAGAALLAVFGTWFGIHPTARLVSGHDGRGAEPVVWWTSAFAILVVAQMCIGMLFGSVQTGTASLTEAAGVPGAAGLIHAVLGIGSVTAGLAMAALPERIRYASRMLVAAGAMLVLSAPLLLVDSIGALVFVIAVLGFAVAPYMISNFALAGVIVPIPRVGTAMTLLAGATGLGYAIGAAIAGRLADIDGHTAAFGVTVAATVVAVVVAATAQGTLRRAPVVNG